MTEEIRRIIRRLLSTVLRGRALMSDDSGAMQLLQVKLSGLETVDNIPRMVEFGLTSRPPIDSDVLALFVGGDRANSVILATNHASSRPKGLNLGETVVFNQVGIKIYLSNSGLTIDGAGLPLTVNNAPTVTVNASTSVTLDTPNLYVSGNILADGDVTDNAAGTGKSMASMRSSYDSHYHPIEEVQTGLSTINSDKPSPQM